ncbi:MAG: WD40 repeat domain-containing protein [Scytonema sp. PMC 1069.18]|nr:WD40 repeat domain-containing protein [Scytonema sp. PMC 1069.18]MEC4881899.1 WD40 repeat domain-containing protein [Scytonema sp. PMC 1070.18]
MFFPKVKKFNSRRLIVNLQSKLSLKSKISFAKNFVLVAIAAAAVTIAPLIHIPSAVSADIEFTPLPQATTNFANPRLVYSFLDHSGTVKSLAFSPDSRVLFSGGAENDGVIRLWDTLTGKRFAVIRKAHKTAVESMLISPDGQTLASCSTDNTINLWNLPTYRFTRSFVGHTSNVLSLALSPNGKVLASGGLDGIRLWDFLQQRPLGTLTRFDNNIYTLAISPDGQTLASGDNKGVIKLWDLNSGTFIRSIPKAHSDAITKLAFTTDGTALASSSRDYTIKLWNPNTTDLIRTLRGHNNWVNAIAINPNGQTLASAGRDGIKIWNLNTGELLNTVYGHTDWVSSITFSPDGTKLATGGFDRRVNVWLGQ